MISRVIYVSILVWAPSRNRVLETYLRGQFCRVDVRRICSGLVLRGGGVRQRRRDDAIAQRQEGLERGIDENFPEVHAYAGGHGGLEAVLVLPTQRAIGNRVALDRHADPH